MSSTLRESSALSTGKDSGDGGNEGRKPSGLNPKAEAFVPKPKPIVGYTREFETRTQFDHNEANNLVGPYRTRSYSFGNYNPNTNMRENRAHIHYDNFGPTSGIPIPKPPEPGFDRGNVHLYQFHNLPDKK